MAFVSCDDIQTVEKDAFNIMPFRNLEFLCFLSMTSVEFKQGAFNGLENLRIVIIQNTTIVNAIYNFWEPIAQTIRKLTLRDIPSATNMYNLLDGTELKRLASLTIVGCSKFCRKITSNSITKMPIIRILQLLSCGIEVIQTGSFDHFIGTLEILNLRYNRLKTLPSNLFEVHQISTDLYYFDYNKWECTCEIMELAAKIDDFYDYLDLDCETYGQNCTNKHSAEALITKHCAAHYGTNFLRITYANMFMLNVNRKEHIFYMKGTKRATFYLIGIPSGNNSNYSDWCLTATAKYAIISLQKIRMAVGIHLVCLIDDKIKKKVWPLNCYSFRIEGSPIITWIGEEHKIIVLMIFALVYMLGFGAMTFLGTIIVKRYLFFLVGVDRIVFDRNKTSNRIETVLIMPLDWKRTQKLRYVDLYLICNSAINIKKDSYNRIKIINNCTF